MTGDPVRAAAADAAAPTDPVAAADRLAATDPVAPEAVAPADPIAAADRLATELLAPAAAAVEAAGRVPASHLDALAAAGLYGVIGPREAGGAGGDLQTLCAVAERLAAGCLSTTFVWLQHHGAIGSVAASADPALIDRWLAPLCRGSVHAGVAFSALRRPGPPAMVATRAGEDWRLDGTAPWVTGFDHADVIRVGAREAQTGALVWLLVDAERSSTFTTQAVHPVAVDAADTVTLALTGHPVAGDRLLGVEDYDAWREADRRPGSLRPNGSLALGLVRRCLAELETDSGPLDAARAALDGAETTAAMAAARAAASDLALHAARTLVAARGGSGVVAGQLAERTAREALFTLVFGQAPAIRAAQLGG